MTRTLMPSIIAVSLSRRVLGDAERVSRFRSAALTGIALNVVTIGCVVALQREVRYLRARLRDVLGPRRANARASSRVFGDRDDIGSRSTCTIRACERCGRCLGRSSSAAQPGSWRCSSIVSLPRRCRPGYMSGMNYVTKLVNFPQQIFAAAIATVIFPLLAAQFARENRQRRRAQRGHGPATGELHHDPVGLRADRVGPSDGTNAFRARNIRSRRHRADVEPVAVCGGWTRVACCKRRADALLLRVP